MNTEQRAIKDFTPEEQSRYLKYKNVCDKMQKVLGKRRANKQMNNFFSGMVAR